MFGGAGEAQSDVYFDGDEVFSFIETNTGNHKSKKRKVYISYLRLQVFRQNTKDGNTALGEMS